jgi:peptide/nickel transport system substrate-binding protein
MHRRIGWLLTGVAIVSLLTAVSAQTVKGGATLLAALDLDPPTMDPHLSGSAVDRQVYQNLYDKLVDIDENLAIVPMLATSWKISPDGRTVVFKLRQGVKFHDGTPFNAEAVKYNFDRMRDPKFPSARRSEIAPVTTVVAIDPVTVQITLERPYSPLLYVLTDRAGMMVSPAAGQKEGLNFALHPVGTGAFAFTEKVPQDHITLQRNPGYWDTGLPRLERIVFRMIPDDNARVANLKSGDVDIINRVPLPQIKELAKEATQPGARFRLLQRGAIAWTGIALNVTKPPFDNKLLRQAFAATIDRDALASVVLQGAAYPAYSFFPNGTPAFDPAWKLPPRNLALAKEKLQAAGHPGGFAFTFLTQPGQQRQAVAQAIQAMAADAGIQMKIQIVDEGTIIDAISHLKEEAAVIEWSGRPDPDFDVYPFTTQSGIGSFNYTGYVNQQLQTVLDAARYLSDMSQRKRAYGDVTKILAEDVPYLMLFFPKEYKLVSARVKGFVHVPDGMMRLRTVSVSP